MLEGYKSAAAVLATTLMLGLPAHGVRAAGEQTGADAAKPAAEEAVSESGEREPTNGIKTVDALAVRPVTFVSSIFSAGAFVLALPFSALDPAIDVEKTRRTMVDYPFQDTFQRPLGEFNGAAWGDP